MSGADYSIQLREDAVPFAMSTPRRVSIPLMDVVKRDLQRLVNIQVRRVDTPTDWCAGRRGLAQSSLFYRASRKMKRRHIRCEYVWTLRSSMRAS